MPQLVKLITVISLFALTACSTHYFITTTGSPANSNERETIAMFLDGTDNNLNADTNVSRIYNKVKGYDMDHLHTYYGEGVGVGFRYIGAGTGWGFDDDVAEAYAFLTKFYKSNNTDIYIFGFSRGAYTARVLNGMVYSLGIYDFSSLSSSERIKKSKQLYEIYKQETKIHFDEDGATLIGLNPNDSRQGNQCRESDVLNIWEDIDEKTDLAPPTCDDMAVSIKFMGLFDTVEALGIVPTGRAIKRKLGDTNQKPNVSLPNKRYIDQVCNVETIYHALSLDDNRGHLFVPISIDTPDTKWRCRNQNTSINEVWFAGAHSDVGGGYLSTDHNGKSLEYLDLRLSGYAANWMLSYLKQNGLMSSAALFPEYIKADLHDAQNGSSMYEEFSRDRVFSEYASILKGKKFKVHPSAIERIGLNNYTVSSTNKPYPRLVSYGHFNDYGFDSKWYESETFAPCFETIETQKDKGKVTTLIFKPDNTQCNIEKWQPEEIDTVAITPIETDY
ncbi:T6SS phospholipase effector Tle1-like catalytic domain-containing protein [Vibrio ordalii]|uniref:T6SS Phospholipase effector Tle1-like catalytic domain-containing protein n=1 Tax=Vibrio ordalii FS-238 TaxID=617133 RepID=A0A853QYW4_9VIBR|nr:DUF2235 domain-containing protein [Vibrio ordalii]OEE32288.1 hypothetical protein A1QS_09985 [Vibrio ordalii FS-238]